MFEPDDVEAICGHCDHYRASSETCDTFTQEAALTNDYCANSSISGVPIEYVRRNVIFFAGQDYKRNLANIRVIETFILKNQSRK